MNFIWRMAFFQNWMVLDFPGPGTRQLSNLNYGVCIQMVPGYCSIEWTQSVIDKYSFTVSGDTEALDDTLLGNNYHWEHQ